jgi:hypothetical protein
LIALAGRYNYPEKSGRLADFALRRGNEEEKQGNRPSLELMPGLFRKETGSGTKIIYQWFRGTGSLSLKVFEILLFTQAD